MRLVKLLLVLLTLSACRYDDAVSLRYVGRYRCKHVSVCYGALGNCRYESEELVSIRTGATDTTFELLGRDLFFGTVDCGYDYHFSACLAGDSLHINFMNGGLGGGMNETYDGIKVDDQP